MKDIKQQLLNKANINEEHFCQLNIKIPQILQKIQDNVQLPTNQQLERPKSQTLGGRLVQKFTFSDSAVQDQIYMNENDLQQILKSRSSNDDDRQKTINLQRKILDEFVNYVNCQKLVGQYIQKLEKADHLIEKLNRMCSMQKDQLKIVTVDEVQQILSLFDE